MFTIPVLLASLVSAAWGYRVVRIWLQINLGALRLICKLRYRIEGRENIPDQAGIVLSKHQSTFETLCMPMILTDPVFVAKRELALIPCFGWCLYTLQMILIRRGSGRAAIRQMTEQSLDRMAQGRWVVVFPEGTRRPPGAEPIYKVGGAVVSHQTGASVLPIAHNAGEFWPRLSFIKWPGEMTLIIGPPISPEGKTPDEILSETQQWIESQQSQITQVDRFPY